MKPLKTVHESCDERYDEFDAKLIQLVSLSIN